MKAKFRKEGSKASPAISTASLPDIVFMLLFFFMVATVMRETELKVDMKIPSANQISKLERKDLVGYVYIGKPSKDYQQAFGKNHRIQLNDQFADLKNIPLFVEEVRARIKASNEREVGKMTIALKIDGEAKMKMVTDVKTELRKVNALRINYNTNIGENPTIEL